MSYHLARPNPFLARYIKQFWMISNCVAPGNAYDYRIVPSGLIEINFYLGDKPQVNEPGKQLAENCLVSGQLKSAYNLHISKSFTLFSVTFQPSGAKAFFDLPMDELCDMNIPLRFIDKDFADKMENEIFEAATFEVKVKVAEKLLMERLFKKDRELDMKRIAGSLDVIKQKHSDAIVSALASKACLSQKQFERVFSSTIGISPKKYLRIVRFQHAIYTKQTNCDLGLTQLAYDSGYFDQSHMINDFRKLAGMTPSDFFAGCDPYSDYFSV